MNYKTSIFVFLFGTIFVGLVLAGCQTGNSSSESLDPVAQQGKKVFKNNCAACHSASDETVIVGPSLAGIATSAESREEALTGREYIITSIIKPEAYIVEGYEDLMPSDYGIKLTGEQLDALVMYLFTLK